MKLYEAIVNNPIRKSIADLLGTEIINSKFIFISFWSIIHFLFGGLIFYLIEKAKVKKTKNKFLILFLILVTYEVIEFFLYQNLTMLFFPETMVDIIWDLIIGMLGGVVYNLLKRK